MPRRRKAPPTRFPHAVAASYSRRMTEMIQQMHSITYEAFRAVVAGQAVQYREESARADAALDVILAALEWARRRSEAVVFTEATMLQAARRFLHGVNFFNRNNIAQQVERVRGFDPTDNEPWLDSFMRAAVAENVTLINSIEQDYFRRAESIVLQVVKNGQSTRFMAEELRKTADISYNRAKFIARDQTGSILGQLTEKRHQAAGASRFRWSTSGDSRVRTEHRAFDGKVYTYADGAGPRHLKPGQDFSCRCVAYPVFDDEPIDEQLPAAPEPDENTTTEPENDIMQTEQQFDKVVSQAPHMTAEYKAILIERFNRASGRMKRIFSKYVTRNVVKNGDYRSGAHYNPNEKVVNMDFSDDMKNPRGNGATFFHEYGHYVDNMAAMAKLGRNTVGGVSHMAIGSVRDRDFYKAILDDIQNYLETYRKSRKISLTQAQNEIRNRFSREDSAIYSAVSDVYGGATGNRLRGDYGHAKAYWRQLPNALEKEAFAHMFEASFDPDGKRVALIKEFLPTAYEIFQKIMEEI